MLNQTINTTHQFGQVHIEVYLSMNIVKCVMSCDTHTHVMPVSNSATSCCQGGCQPRRPASDRQTVYLDQCYGEHLMCSASNVYRNDKLGGVTTRLCDGKSSEAT